MSHLNMMSVQYYSCFYVPYYVSYRKLHEAENDACIGALKFYNVLTNLFGDTKSMIKSISASIATCDY